MKLADHLSEQDKNKLNKFVQRNRKDKKEKVNWIEIMGMNRPTYKRVRGAIRRK